MTTYKCRTAGCGASVEATKKPGKCTRCRKNSGWDMAIATTTTERRDTSDAPEWDNAASAALASEVLVAGQTLDTLGGEHGLPSTACLTALYEAIKLPKGGKLAKSIYFSAVAGVYDVASATLTKTELASNTPYAINSTASQCAERALWKAIGTSLDGKTLLGIGQDTRPCLMCCARFSALANSKRLTIMIYFQKGYDALPGNTWLVFAPTADNTAYTS